TASLRAAQTNPARRTGHRNEQTQLFKAGAPRSMSLRAAQPFATHAETRFYS
ncbi:hypothetical protein A2U01_0118068, partial [Trifolium medium]|nr:hypothetical protein [Trifolium medium]